MADYKKKTMVEERGLKIEPPLHAYIERYSWQAFAGRDRLRPGDHNLIYEVYARLQVEKEREMTIDGHTVDFSARAINAFFDLPNFGVNYDQRQVDERDIYRELTGQEQRQADWRHIRKSELRAKARLINHFVRSRLMPTSSNPEVLKMRAHLIYAISTGVAVNVGRVISDQMVVATKTSKSNLSLGFPNLITAMCVKAGIRPRGDPATFIQLMSDLRFEAIKDRQPDPLQHESPPPSPPPHHQTLPPPSPPPSPPHEQQQHDSEQPEPETVREQRYLQLREDIDTLRTHVDDGFLQIRSELQSHQQQMEHFMQTILSRLPPQQPPQ
ncbi:hypothetical protein BVER_05350 [Candidatus Burkholderia verschuerenii]|uniref:Putative plant transposon protein domain-containing protein n=1 Tax=Candidatus Burkholderia verschuerenii TaxID=242163 RepID=A0A0L0M2I1_9BURK|nr:hypothetical protein [Candidatus Burkholderia verschuerenii]KND56189.1 hypothetical protein BVER_05350 [Candidatus Burkholderia verschuerenii]